MRIIAGSARGRRLATPRRERLSRIRPTSDRVREALFSMLQARCTLEGAAVLDLFAGTGAVGCEALSRGASSVVFVDNFRESIGIVQENLSRINAPPQVVLKNNCIDAIPRLKGPFDLIFLDPPYAEHLVAKTLSKLADNPRLLHKETIICAEHGTGEPPPDGEIFTQLSLRTYGDTTLSLWTLNIEENSP